MSIATTAPDILEQLFGDRLIGRRRDVSVPWSRIKGLRAVLVQLDPQQLVPGNLFYPPAQDPWEFYGGIRRVLNRHPILRHAEVRTSGNGLDLLIWLRRPLDFCCRNNREYWDWRFDTLRNWEFDKEYSPAERCLVRPLGAIDPETGRQVVKIVDGSPVWPDEIAAYDERVAAEPFRQNVGILLGGFDRVSPCPKCRQEDSELDMGRFEGQCSRCGTVDFGDVWSLIGRA